MRISASTVKDLRERSGAGIMECKRALEEATGDIEKALALLHDQGFLKAEQRAHRETRQGMVEVYVHAGGRIGALVEVNCETDFVGRTDTFKDLAHDLVLQIAAANPLFLSADDVPPEDGTDPSEVALLEQPFIKDPGKSVRELVNEVIGKTGENIRVRRFARFELGGD